MCLQLTEKTGWVRKMIVITKTSEVHSRVDFEGCPKWCWLFSWVVHKILLPSTGHWTIAGGFREANRCLFGQDIVKQINSFFRIISCNWHTQEFMLPADDSFKHSQFPSNWYICLNLGRNSYLGKKSSNCMLILKQVSGFANTCNVICWLSVGSAILVF